MNSVPLSVVIVSWNGMRQLPECLAALLPQLPPDAEVILVDNGSTDGTPAWARANHPQLRMIALPENLGFAGGVNAGLRAARGDLLLLINDDAFVEPGFVAALLDVMTQRPDVGAAGGVLLFAHRPEIVASAGIRVRRDWLALDLWAGQRAAELPTDPQPIMGRKRRRGAVPTRAARRHRADGAEFLQLPGGCRSGLAGAAARLAQRRRATGTRTSRLLGHGWARLAI